MKRPLRLRVCSCRRSYVSVRRKSNQIFATVNPAFVSAPQWVIQALGAYLEQGKDGSKLELFFDFWDVDSSRSSRSGRHVHDLPTIVHGLISRYRLRGLRVSVIWDQRSTLRPGQLPRLASFRVESRTIVVSRLLDRKTVPQFVLEWIIFHELLHAVHKVRRHNGRRVFHPRTFRNDERRFSDRVRALTWVRRHMANVLPF